MGKQASCRVPHRQKTYLYNPYRKSVVTRHTSPTLKCIDVQSSADLEDGEISEDCSADSCASLDFEDGEIGEVSSTVSSAGSDRCWGRANHSYSNRWGPRLQQIQTLLFQLIRETNYPPSTGFKPRATPLCPHPIESQLDFYIRAAAYKYNRILTHHSGIISRQHPLNHTCAAPSPGQKTCTHLSTTPGDIINYVPAGTAHDVSGDCPGLPKLTRHFMVLLPPSYKPAALQCNPTYHAALVISKNPVGPHKLLCPQHGDENYKATNVPILQTLVFDAHSSRRSLVLDDEFDRRWEWKANTSVAYQVKIVHQESLHAVIYPQQPTYGLRLSDGAFQTVLRDLVVELGE
ncbi:MAG: hypothetical protein Q9182_001202 [Xanthomendoza sp. 2 TL-2023]